MTSDLKQEFDAELSALCREFDDKGLDPELMQDALDWHAELAGTRTDDTERAFVRSD